MDFRVQHATLVNETEYELYTVYPHSTHEHRAGYQIIDDGDSARMLFFSQPSPDQPYINRVVDGSAKEYGGVIQAQRSL
jgi:hypothetical protein